MMNELKKGTYFIDENTLKELFGLNKETVITGVKHDSNEGTFNFVIYAPGESETF